MWPAADGRAGIATEDALMGFVDRHDAGRRLAPRLAHLVGEHPIVVALPRGGVPVGFEVARALGAPLDVLAVRKLGAPGNPEFGVGAIAEDGTAVLDSQAARRVGMTEELLGEVVEREVRELRRRVERYRDGRAPLEVRGRTVIIVDDGLATGLTDLAAVRAMRARGAGRIVVAVPVGARESVELVGAEADEVVCHTIPRELFGVGRWYEDFSPVSDAEVLALLGGAAPAPAPPADAILSDRPMEPVEPVEPVVERELRLDLGSVTLDGELHFLPRPRGLVIFAHGSGSSRLSPRNRQVAATLNRFGFATLLFDLLTEPEAGRRELVFDIPLLARRLEQVTRWAIDEPATRGLPIGYFGASTGAAAALRAAAVVGGSVAAVVSRGGRPDLAADRLAYVSAATLLLVGSNDHEVLELNRHAAAMLHCPHRLSIVDGAGHLFSEPGALETVAELAVAWFDEYVAVTTPAHAVAGG